MRTSRHCAKLTRFAEEFLQLMELPPVSDADAEVDIRCRTSDLLSKHVVEQKVAGQRPTDKELDL